MHEHKDCRHKFEYCPICDVVYCEKCGKEWRYNQHYYWTYTPCIGNIPYTTYYDNDTMTISSGTNPDVVKQTHTHGT